MVVFHIGYHKTASTWLRRSVFPNMAGVAYQSRNTGILAAWVRHLLEACDEEFLAAGMRETLRECERRAGGSTVVISNEELSGTLLGGGRLGLRNAARLHEVAPDARVLVVIRRQQDMARSIYAQYVNVGGFHSLEAFLEGEGRFVSEDFAYDTLVSRYCTLFGASRVTVLPYELLNDGSEQFLRLVAEVCGVAGMAVVASGGSTNVSLSRYPMLVLRAWNRAFRRSAFNPDPLVFPMPAAAWPRHALQRHVEPHLPEVLRRRRSTERERAVLGSFAQRFEASNARTAALTGWDLKAYGYALPARASD